MKKHAEPCLVTVCIQAITLLGLAFGEYPQGYWHAVGGLMVCYTLVDIAVLFYGSRSDILWHPVARAALYFLQLLLCIGYGVFCSFIRGS